MSGLKKIIVAIGLLLFISLLFSCKFNDLVEQEGIIYELVEQNNTSKSFYRVKSASKDIEKAVGLHGAIQCGSRCISNLVCHLVHMGIGR